MSHRSSIARVLAALGAIAAAVCPSARLPAADGIRVGSDAADIEGDDSMVIAGGIGPGAAKGQEGKLRAVATVIEGPSPSGGSGKVPADGSPRTRVAIVACDVLMIGRDYVDPAARQIEREIGIPFENILVSCTHTHHAPSTVTIHGYERNDLFCGRVRDAIVEAVRRASKSMESSETQRCEMLFRLGGESSVGQNSRLLLGDGTIFWVGPRDDEVRPTGPFDPDLPVLAFRRPGGGFEAVLFSHSTHTIGALEPGKRSPGFYGMAAQGLEPELGGKVTFIAGAFGSTHNLKLTPAEALLRIREAVREALAAATPMPLSVVRSAKREFTYQVRNFDEAKEEAAVSSYIRKRIGPDSDYAIGVFRKMRGELAPHRGEERKTWLQAVRIGDVAWVAVPGELFTKLGVEIKRRSPFRYTYVAGVANDYIGYIPDAQAFDLGGYQVWTGFHSLVEKGTGEAVVDACVAMLEEIHMEVP